MKSVTHRRKILVIQLVVVATLLALNNMQTRKTESRLATHSSPPPHRNCPATNSERIDLKRGKTLLIGKMLQKLFCPKMPTEDLLHRKKENETSSWQFISAWRLLWAKQHYRNDSKVILHDKAGMQKIEAGGGGGVSGGLTESKAALWVEAETCLLSGEMFVRHLLYDLRAIREELSIRPQQVVLTSSLGYSAHCVNLLKSLGMRSVYLDSQPSTVLDEQAQQRRSMYSAPSHFDWLGQDGISSLPTTFRCSSLHRNLYDSSDGPNQRTKRKWLGEILLPRTTEILKYENYARDSRISCQQENIEASLHCIELLVAWLDLRGMPGLKSMKRFQNISQTFVDSIWKWYLLNSHLFSERGLHDPPEGGGGRGGGSDDSSCYLMYLNNVSNALAQFEEQLVHFAEPLIVVGLSPTEDAEEDTAAVHMLDKSRYWADITESSESLSFESMAKNGTTETSLLQSPSVQRDVVAVGEEGEEEKEEEEEEETLRHRRHERKRLQRKVELSRYSSAFFPSSTNGRGGGGGGGEGRGVRNNNVSTKYVGPLLFFNLAGWRRLEVLELPHGFAASNSSLMHKEMHHPKEWRQASYRNRELAICDVPAYGYCIGGGISSASAAIPPGGCQPATVEKRTRKVSRSTRQQPLPKNGGHDDVGWIGDKNDINDAEGAAACAEEMIAKGGYVLKNGELVAVINPDATIHRLYLLNRRRCISVKDQANIWRRRRRRRSKSMGRGIDDTNHDNNDDDDAEDDRAAYERVPAYSLQVVEDGPLRAGLLARYSVGGLAIKCYIFLSAGSSRLEFQVEMNRVPAVPNDIDNDDDQEIDEEEDLVVDIGVDISPGTSQRVRTDCGNGWIQREGGGGGAGCTVSSPSAKDWQGRLPLRWIELSDPDIGMVIANNAKRCYSVPAAGIARLHLFGCNRNLVPRQQPRRNKLRRPSLLPSIPMSLRYTLAATDLIRPELSLRDAVDLLRPIKIYSGHCRELSRHAIKSTRCATSMVSCQPSGVVLDTVKLRTTRPSHLFEANHDHADGIRFRENDELWKRNTETKLIIRVHEAAGSNGRAVIIVDERYAIINRAEFCDVLETPLNRKKPRIRRIHHGTEIRFNIQAFETATLVLWSDDTQIRWLDDDEEVVEAQATFSAPSDAYITDLEEPTDSFSESSENTDGVPWEPLSEVPEKSLVFDPANAKRSYLGCGG